MTEQLVDPKVAARVYRRLHDHLSKYPEGQDILSAFEQDLEASGEALDNYLRHLSNTDDELLAILSAVPGLPASVRAEVSGGRVEKLIQFARVGKVEIIVQPSLPRGKRFWFVVSTVAVIVIAALAWGWFRFNQLPPMGSGFNVAMAEFAILDANGRTTSTENSKEFSVWLFEAIKKETDQLPAALRVNTRGPEDIGIIQGADRETRAVNAAKVTAQHNATILIYGVITAGADGYQIEPEFYVSDQSFGYGSEVAGPDRLGQPIPVNFTSGPGERFELNERLNARTQALQHLVKGLAHFFINRYDDAWNEFRRAADIEGWQAEEGKEVVYLLMGAAQLRLYDRKTNPEALPFALEAFEQAYQLNPDYARNFLGLGAVAFQQAQLVDPVDEAKLVEARDWYSMTLSGPNQPMLAYMPLKAAYGLGQVHLLGFEKRLPNWFGQQAWDFFADVISVYEAEKEPPDLAWFAGHSHAALGRLAGHDKDWQTMSSEYKAAIDILDGLPGESPHHWIARYWEQVAFAKEKLNQLEDAREAYRFAIQVGQDIVAVEELQRWQETLDRLEEGAP